jgi:asparagine synthase (glutamine-hydrolysing)
MCGILALIGVPWRASAEAALDVLRSRGPDDRRLWTRDDATLGHTRLSIVDLAAGAQPMSDREGRRTIVFNGEIYNFADLRRELKARGRRFTTRSDTEVLLEGFAEWGPSVVTRLDGIFAFAIWDAKARRLFAARDRMGVKPLLYSTRHGLTLASTLEPFFALEGFPRALDFEALRDYLAFQTTLAPHTFLRDVRQLPPAHTLAWDADRSALVVEGYWRPPAPVDPPRNESAEERLRRLDRVAARAVRRQLSADVPHGVFLSGGVDSSLAVHYMAEAGAKPLKTFNVRFRQAAFDESAAALAVSRRYGTEHHVVEALQLDAALLSEAVSALDQPMADPAYVPSFELARRTAAHVRIAVSGDGGDELFGGYSRFADVESLHPDGLWKRALRRGVAAGLLPGLLLRRGLVGQEMLLYKRVQLGPWPKSRKSMARYLKPDALAAARPEDTLGLWRSLANGYGGRMDSAALMRADLWTYLSENCLVKTDRAAMAHGLEVRVPFLADDLADFALEQPAEPHLKPERKALLRALARRHLPREVWDRPKHGLSVPLGDLFDGPWREPCEDAVRSAQDLAPFLRADQVAAQFRAARAGRGSRRLAYTFVVLLLWLRKRRLS